MNTLVKRTGAVAAMVALGLMTNTPEVRALTSCSQWITSAGDDQPLTGWLVGEHQLSTTRTFSWSFTHFGGTFSGSSVTTQSYSVGFYQMSNGTVQQLRCDAYMPV